MLFPLWKASSFKAAQACSFAWVRILSFTMGEDYSFVLKFTFCEHELPVDIPADFNQECLSSASKLVHRTC